MSYSLEKSTSEHAKRSRKIKLHEHVCTLKKDALHMEIFCQTMAATYPTDYLAYDKKAQNQFNTFTGLQCICSGKHSVPFRKSVSDLGF